MSHTKANLLLLLASFIWGTAFISQKTGMGAIGPFTFSFARFFFAFLTVLPLAIYFERYWCRRTRRARACSGFPKGWKTLFVRFTFFDCVIYALTIRVEHTIVEWLALTYWSFICALELHRFLTCTSSSTASLKNSIVTIGTLTFG